MSANSSIPPVAFLIFNRPELTARVFAAIREARPPTLLVVADGPRSGHPTDESRCAATRKVIEAVDWPCDVSTNFSTHNMGCGSRVSSGITWVFQEVERAIILEDDCLPHPSFFEYCAHLLDRFESDEKVMHIGGTNFQRGRRRGSGSYYFSKYAHIWGWATWRRAWQKYDFEMRGWPAFRESRSFAELCETSSEREYWTGIFDGRYHAKTPDTWDYQWVYTLWAAGGLCINPQVNLVSNLGFGPDATHTTGASQFAEVPVNSLERIVDVQRVRNARADRFTFNHVFQNTPPLWRRAGSAVKRLLTYPGLDEAVL